LFIVADNCSTNGAVVRFEEINVPLIGCKAHIFNLALKLVFKGACEKKGKDGKGSISDGPITKVHKIMNHLDTLKNRGILRENEIHYAPVLDNETRWTSKYSMLKRYYSFRRTTNSGNYGRNETAIFNYESITVGRYYFTRRKISFR
jgi:hypothetical protein